MKNKKSLTICKRFNEIFYQYKPKYSCLNQNSYTYLITVVVSKGDSAGPLSFLPKTEM